MEDKNVNVVDFSGKTPLHSAATHGTAHSAQALVSLGADATALTKSQQTPLDLAKQCSPKNPHMITYLEGLAAETTVKEDPNNEPQ